jgi:hypothetical protein
MQRRKMVISVVILILFGAMSVGLAAATVTGGGKQVRGYPGHNAELSGDIFILPSAGTIVAVEGEHTDGFWIENSQGTMVASFGSLKQAQGYTLAAGKYRVLPNLEKGRNSAWVRVTFNCP